MNRHAVILGTIRWIAREFAGRTPQFSPARVMLSSAEFLARSAPEAAAAMLGGILSNPFVAGLLSASENSFDAVVEALRQGVKANEKMVFYFPMPAGPIPYSVTETDIQNLAASIRQAAQEIGPGVPQ